jgi:hypothetical protein
LIYCWAIGFGVRKSQAHCKVSAHTVVEWSSTFHKLGILCYLEHFPQVLGGPNDFVEIYKTPIFTRKYHSGWVLVSRSVWGFGAIFRRTKRVALKIDRKRSAESLTAFVKANIDLGTTIVTDMWRGYNDSQNNKFAHLKVNQC